MNKPLISIIIPTYNRASMLKRAIESVISQTYSNWELIIVDDGSVDDTREVVASYNDDRIHYSYQNNQEKCIARNTGISRAKGLYICFLDNDDYFLPFHLEEYCKVIETNNNPVAMLISGLYIEEQGIRKEHPMFDPQKETALRFVWKTFIVPGSVCLHRDILKKYRFSTEYYIWEDRHLWLRILTEFPLIQVPRFSNVLVEHKNRFTKLFYHSISLPIVKMYFNCIQDLLASHGKQLQKEISAKEIRDFIADKHLAFLQIAVKRSQVKESLYLVAGLLKYKPQFVLTPLFFKLMLLLPLNKIKPAPVAIAG